ncbi:MAG: lactonase family protein [Gammaproteobacteria bacterium]
MKISFRSVLSTLMLSALPLFPAFAEEAIGRLYTMSNDVNANEILVYQRYLEGGLSPLATVPTNGYGTGTGLGNQGAIVLSAEGDFLFAVNAGSDSISSFRITQNGLELIETEDSGGIRPVSVTEDHGRLFVLNAGDNSNPGNIKGFRIQTDGALEPIANSVQTLSSDVIGTGAAQIQFSGNGKQLIVTEKATNLILTYQLDANDVPTPPRINESAGQTPFGFAVGKRKQIFVSNAEAGAAGISSMSSYKLSPRGRLKSISPEVTAGETAACWVVLAPSGRFAFTTNAGSGTVSSFRVGFNGKITVADNDAGNTGTGSGPIDMAISPDGRFLYTLNSGNETISSFAVNWGGQLTLLDTTSDLPDGANGLIVQ